jgi:hypothetical protein
MKNKGNPAGRPVFLPPDRYKKYIPIKIDFNTKKLIFLYFLKLNCKTNLSAELHWVLRSLRSG